MLVTGSDTAYDYGVTPGEILEAGQVVALDGTRATLKINGKVQFGVIATNPAVRRPVLVCED